jgi:hypothetical protein
VRQVGEWERALVAAPAVSVAYWSRLASQYADVLRERNDEHAAPLLVAVGRHDDAARTLEAAGEISSALSVAQSACGGGFQRIARALTAVPPAAPAAAEGVNGEHASMSEGGVREGGGKLPSLAAPGKKLAQLSPLKKPGGDVLQTGKEAGGAGGSQRADGVLQSEGTHQGNLELMKVSLHPLDPTGPTCDWGLTFRTLQGIGSHLKMSYLLEGKPLLAGSCHLACGEPAMALASLVQGHEIPAALMLCQVVPSLREACPALHWEVQSMAASRFEAHGAPPPRARAARAPRRAGCVARVLRRASCVARVLRAARRAAQGTLTGPKTCLTASARSRRGCSWSR